MSTTHIPVVIGTAREGRQSEAIAEAIVQVIGEIDSVTTELVDVKDHVAEAVTVPAWGSGGANEHPTKWKEIVQNAQALILVIPEYNHGYPGELKLLLDSLWEEYKGKPVGLVGVSAGTLGGARVVDHIKPVLIELYLQPMKEAAVYISNAKEAVADDGSFTDQKTVEYVTKMVRALEGKK